MGMRRKRGCGKTERLGWQSTHTQMKHLRKKKREDRMNCLIILLQYKQSERILDSRDLPPVRLITLLRINGVTPFPLIP
jgi:hypothetical protein